MPDPNPGISKLPFFNIPVSIVAPFIKVDWVKNILVSGSDPLVPWLPLSPLVPLAPLAPVAPVLDLAKVCTFVKVKPSPFALLPEIVYVIVAVSAFIPLWFPTVKDLPLSVRVVLLVILVCPLVIFHVDRLEPDPLYDNSVAPSYTDILVPDPV